MRVEHLAKFLFACGREPSAVAAPLLDSAFVVPQLVGRNTDDHLPDRLGAPARLLDSLAHNLHTHLEAVACFASVASFVFSASPI